MAVVFGSPSFVLESPEQDKGKGTPKILFVNGHWNKILNKISAAPGQGGKGYWNYFTNFDDFKTSAENYFQIKNSSSIFIDGSSFFGGDQSGEQRKNKGYEYARKNYDNIIFGLQKEKVFLISHSEGGAYAAGIAKYLFERGISIGESVMLSTDEGDEFSIEESYPSYQIVAGYIENYYDEFGREKKTFIIDPVVCDNKIKGITRYGVLITDYSFSTVHGSTIDKYIFHYIEELKTIPIISSLNSIGKGVYITQSRNWAKIDDYILCNESRYENYQGCLFKLIDLKTYKTIII